MKFMFFIFNITKFMMSNDILNNIRRQNDSEFRTNNSVGKLLPSFC